MVGALARPPVPTQRLSEATVEKRARRMLKRRGDCGWSGLIELMLGRARSSLYWLIEKRDQWPAAMAAWPEERIRTMTFALRKNQRTWLTKSLIEVIDGEYPRDLWKCSNGLDLMRATHAPRT